jgi:dolichol-phosphate mannosyltransferase
MIKIKTILAYPQIKENTFTLPRYILVSLASFILGTLILWLLTDKAHWFYIISATIGAMVSIISDFFLNEAWTFSRRRQDGFSAPRLIQRFLKHLLSKAIGLGIALSVLALVTQVFGVHYLISNIVGIAASFIWNYALSYFWVWARSRRVSKSRFTGFQRKEEQADKFSRNIKR